MQVYIAQTDFLKDERAFAYYYSLVHPIRAAKVDRMRNPKDKELSLLAGLLLREGILRNGIDYANLRIAYGTYGKPEMENAGGNIHFNLSHSGSLAMAVLDKKAVGCDVEMVSKSEEELMRIAARFFHPQEHKVLCDVPDHSTRKEWFYRIWTMKESVLKACGLGMKLDMRSFCVVEDDGRMKETMTDPRAERKYYLKEFFPREAFLSGGQAYRLSCCGLGSDRAGEPQMLTPESFSR
ncbi:MAG: 4'-phosphopantetheinyl transferase superfamily protein [Lachnospiraceae bacterium]|nr:4'-phosphopantetheinyl transferase superfamily protein [Lachnospiraceae bacterium]